MRYQPTKASAAAWRGFILSAPRKICGALFFLEARIVGRDAIAIRKPIKLLDCHFLIRRIQAFLLVANGFKKSGRTSMPLGHNAIAVCCGIEDVLNIPARAWSIIVWAPALQRWGHQIAADQGERSGVAWLPALHLAEATTG
jgi:hypothetical protein